MQPSRSAHGSNAVAVGAYEGGASIKANRGRARWLRVQNRGAPVEPAQMHGWVNDESLLAVIYKHHAQQHDYIDPGGLPSNPIIMPCSRSPHKHSDHVHPALRDGHCVLLKH